MKNILTLLFAICQVVVYGQFDSLKIYKPQGPDYSRTIYPNDGLTYNQYAGETIAGHAIAEGWRQDSVNGGFNKEIYKNPYVSSQGEYVGFDKQDFARSFAFYRYKKGKRYSGKILDTLDLSYTPPVVRGMLYGNPYYESKGIKVIFEANSVEGLIQGAGTLSALNSKELISHCYFEKGEIVGETMTRGIHSSNIYRKNYEKGSAAAISQTETDKDGNKIVPNNNNKFSLKETYLSLLDPYRFLDPKEKAGQVYRNKTNPNFHNPIFLEPIDLLLYYFSHIGSQEPYKRYKTKHFEVSEFKYEDLRIVFCSLNQLVRGKHSSVIECYDQSGRLIIVRYQNVHYYDTDGLGHPDYEKFYDAIGYGDVLTVFRYGDNGSITKASSYKGVYENDIHLMCDYEDDFTEKIASYPDFKPVSIINHDGLETSKGKN